MSRTPEERQQDAAAGHEHFHGELSSFHEREAAKYADKAVQLRAAGKDRAAARAEKVAERNRRKVTEHQAKLGQ